MALNNQKMLICHKTKPTEIKKKLTKPKYICNNDNYCVNWTFC